MKQIQSPFQQFFDTSGDPLDSGYIYIGVTNQNPETNPLQVYWDDALTIPAVQPIRTSNGYIVNNGTPARLYTSAEDFSLTVKDKRSNVVFAVLDATSLSNIEAQFIAFKNQLQSSSGASLVGFIQNGTGAVLRTLQDKAREVVSRSDFANDVDFNNAKGSKPNIDALGNFDAKVKPTGGTQVNLSDELASLKLETPSGPRDAILYNNSTSVVVFRNSTVMGGFRFRGQYTKQSAKSFNLPSNKTVSVSTNLGAESGVKLENWYAIFAVANDGDATAQFKLMPFLRAGSVSGSNVPLIKAGEAIHTLTGANYSWTSANNLADVDCLVINESGKFSGRVTKITANSASQITLQTVGSLAAYDFVLPAPPGFSHYCYIGSFYFDTAEVRNIADAGIVVKAKMVRIQDPTFTTSGSIPTPIEIKCGGYICPLATAIVLTDTHTISTASLGDHAGYFYHDSANHTIQENYEYKSSSSNLTAVWDGVELPFSQWQSVWYSNGGSLASQRSNAKLEVKGWIEP